MKLYPKRKTDEEYVEFTRKLIARSKWLGFLHALGAIVFLVMAEMIRRMIYSHDGIIPDMSSGVRIGIILGACGGLFIFLAIENLIGAIQYFKGKRVERLMLRYHDELKQNNPALAQPPDNK
jgi:hypothetical protein